MSIERFYHGSPNYFELFNDSMAADGYAAEGIGHYLTNQEWDSKGYSGLDGFVMTVDVDTSNFIDADTPVDISIIEELALKSPELTDVLSNWGMEFPEEVYEDDYTLPDSIEERRELACGMHLAPLEDDLKSDKTLKEVLETVWYEFYRQSPSEFLKNVSEAGYTGFKVPKVDDLVHAIIYDASVINVLSVDQAYATTLTSGQRLDHK